MENVFTACESNDEVECNNVSSNFRTSLSSILKERGFKMAFLNIVSLPAKIDEIRCSMSNKLIDLTAFNETHLDPNITDSIIHLNDYDLIRKDRSRNGGGICIYLHSSVMNVNLCKLILSLSIMCSSCTHKDNFAAMLLF